MHCCLRIVSRLDNAEAKYTCMEKVVVTDCHPFATPFTNATATIYSIFSSNIWLACMYMYGQRKMWLESSSLNHYRKRLDLARRGRDSTSTSRTPASQLIAATKCYAGVKILPVMETRCRPGPHNCRTEILQTYAVDDCYQRSQWFLPKGSLTWRRFSAQAMPPTASKSMTIPLQGRGQAPQRCRVTSPHLFLRATSPLRQ